MRTGIYVPSRGRPAKAAETLSQLPDTAMVVIYAFDAFDYAKVINPLRLLVVPSHVVNIGQKRHWIINEWATAVADDLCWMIDDDIRMDGGERLTEGIQVCSLEVEKWGLDLVSFGNRFMVNQRAAREGAWSDYGYMCRAWAVRRATYDRLTAAGAFSMAEWPIDEDTALMMTIVSRGGLYKRSNVFLVNETKNTGGGCDSYRQAGMIEASMHRMAQLYPDVVRVVPSNATQHGQFLGVKTRTSWVRLRELQMEARALL